MPTRNLRARGECRSADAPPVGAHERRANGLPSLRRVSRGYGRKARATGAWTEPVAVDENVGAVCALQVAGRGADPAGTRSDTWRDTPRGVCGRRAEIVGGDKRIHGGSAGIRFPSASYVRRDEREGLDAVGLSAHGSSPESVRGVNGGYDGDWQ